jgi:transcriptional regulator with XRE-family HTH domain
MRTSSRRTPAHLSNAIRSILSSRGLSLAEISRQSHVRFSGNPLFWITPNFYDALHHVSFTPSLHQLFALSVLTSYRLADWLRLFRFSFDAAARFQASWPRSQTVELDARVYDPNAEISWFEEARRIDLGEDLTSLNLWLSGKTSQPLETLTGRADSRFRYLKIGTDDAYAYPDLLPESIVRVDPRIPAEHWLSENRPDCILAIEHSRGITCSRLRASGQGRAILCSGEIPYAPVEVNLGTEARILGVVDLEIRRLDYRGTPAVSSYAARHWLPAVLDRPAANGKIGDRLRRARVRSGLSFHEASNRTREIARTLNHSHYFCAASALSDMEAGDLFPRHIHKLISLSAVYCLSVGELAGLAGLFLESAGQEPMPEEWIRIPKTQSPLVPRTRSRFLRAVEDRFEEIPLFLRSALPTLLGLPNPSVRDLFWAGATAHLSHPYLKNAAFLAVNRKSKTPAPSLFSPVWAQPLYILELRDGRQLCAACTLQNGTLLVRRCTTNARSLVRLRNHVEVEVLGRVVAVVRRLEMRVDAR